MSLAVLYEGGAYSLSGKIMGRQAAGADFLRALAGAHYDKLWCYAPAREGAQAFATALARAGSARTGVAWIPSTRPSQLAEPGLLYRPDPGIGQHAWHRLAHADARAYSICGITHTLSSHGPISAFADFLTAPVQPWDALICTSTAARDAVRFILEQTAESLSERLGAQRFTLPQLPVIPLGVHTDRFSFTSEERAKARNQLGLSDDEVAVLYAGRLVVHGKAHPLPVYLALETIAKGRKIVLLQAGKAPNDQILRIYTEEPKRFCPSVRIVMVDGADTQLYRASWAAADLFTSLSDNFQETFGITPLEAMAAGLPVVVSDWNGYRDTVRDNIDGFRVPTMSLPSGSQLGSEIADLYEMGLNDFDMFSAYTSQLVAVDVSAAAEAYRKLIDSPELRRQMGDAGARRVRQDFEWSVVFRRYQVLWDELAERRRADPQLTPALTRRRRPDRPDAFSMFSTYPSYRANSKLSFRCRSGTDWPETASRRDLLSTNFAKQLHPSAELIEKITSVVGQKWTTLNQIQSSMPDQEEKIMIALTWMSKVGAIEFRRS